MAKTIYYAFKKEKDGPKIYGSWKECRMAATRYSRVEFKRFRSLAAAEAWLLPALMCTASESTLPLPTKKSLKKPIVLSAEQSKILERVKNGGNVFVTGPAGSCSHMDHPIRVVLCYILSTRILGTGKTVLLDEIVNFLRTTRRKVAVTASTGIASINLRGGGTTLHSWAGIGLGKETAKYLSGKIRGRDYLRERWQSVESLIIDESKVSSLPNELMPSKGPVSMTSGVLFDKLVGLYAPFFA
ncbi:PIF1-like helicase-domain-containing protein [Lactarius akahatsu]|uniref:ATP-dependent DNA helicase n=1 Tax=Lactarius akahatsu TaxID=416441 RepID=A0AAD4QB47_9AGAM|nr:PIF1-like helicase-domain-containing protein [Lactarius akahatsu]